MSKIVVKNLIINIKDNEFISLTDIARYGNSSEPNDVIRTWLRSKGTISFLGLWEKFNNPSFKPVEFDGFRKEAGDNYFSISPQKWIREVNAIGIVSTSGRYGGTYAHKDIAFEFASWISPKFKIYLIKEFQRLKEEEEKHLGWDIKRNLTKKNYLIHTDAIKENLIPKSLKDNEIRFVYASEADVLNMALFGKTAKQWRDENPNEKGNIRDFANVSQLVCLVNLENLNAHFIKENISQDKRLQKLNEVAIEQMKVLTMGSVNYVKKLE